MHHNSTLIAFRAAFLRSVARIWRYTKNGKTPEIITKVKIRESLDGNTYPGKYDIVKLSDDDSLFAVLTKGDPSVDGKIGQVIGWNTHVDVALCKAISNPHKKQEKEYVALKTGNSKNGLLGYFGYECPWKLDIELSLDQKRRADWKPEVTAGW